MAMSSPLRRTTPRKPESSVDALSGPLPFDPDDDIEKGLPAVCVAEAAPLTQWKRSCVMTLVGLGLCVCIAGAYVLVGSTTLSTVLSLDGGGVRGQIEVESLIALEEEIKRAATRREIFLPEDFHLDDVFDYVVGTSTGGIVGAAIRMRIPLRRIRELFIQLPSLVFKKSVLQWLQYEFDNSNLKSLLHNHISNGTRRVMSDVPKPFGVVAIDEDDHEHVMLRNFDKPPYDYDITTALLATSAAPTYFPSIKCPFTHHKLTDGGIGFNNPSGLMLARLKRDRAKWKNQVVWISLGTGVVTPKTQSIRPEVPMYDRSQALISMFTSTEPVHRRVNKTMTAGGHRYYRFNPKLGEEVGLAETNESTLTEMRNQAIRWLTTPAVGQNLEAAANALLDRYLLRH